MILNNSRSFCFFKGKILPRTDTLQLFCSFFDIQAAILYSIDLVVWPIPSSKFNTKFIDEIDLIKVLLFLLFHVRLKNELIEKVECRGKELEKCEYSSHQQKRDYEIRSIECKMCRKIRLPSRHQLRLIRNITCEIL